MNCAKSTVAFGVALATVVVRAQVPGVGLKGPVRSSTSNSVNVIEPDDSLFFRDEPAAQRDQRGPLLHVRIIVNFSSRNPLTAKAGNADLQGLVGILRKIARDPRIGQYSALVSFIPAQQVVYREEDPAGIDLPAIGNAVKLFNFATVDLKQLAVKNGETEFLERLAIEGLKNEKNHHADALICVGPKYYIHKNVSRKSVERLGIDLPVFYLNYKPNRFSNSWRDAWSDIMARVMSMKPGGQSSNSTF